ncbi:MAG: AmmeMemoRadiSam system protein B [Bacteroidales bacterium]
MTEGRTNIRPPGVAGMFYPAGRDALNELIEELLREEGSNIDPDPVPGNILGGIVPHAGIVYCGRQAVHFFESVRRSSFTPDTVIIAHPGHHRSGPPLSTDDHDHWEVSNGIIETDLEFAEEINLPFSASAQKGEHSAEVIVPYIIHFFPESVRIVSLNMIDQEYESAREVAGRIFTATQKLGRRILLIASSDFSHFVSRSEAQSKDEIVVNEILDRNSKGVYSKIRENNISVCGYGPIMTLMEYSATIDPDYRVKILSRGDSGSIRDSSDVVSYLSALFHT